MVFFFSPPSLACKRLITPLLSLSLSLTPAFTRDNNKRSPHTRARARSRVQAARTEAEKLRAVGKRNQVAAEAEMRKRKKAETAALFAEKQGEIHRLQAEYESLLKVKAEQELLIAKLSDSSA